MKAKSIESLPLSILHAFYKQTMSMALQHVQAILDMGPSILFLVFFPSFKFFFFFGYFGLFMIGKVSSRFGLLFVVFSLLL
jgi:hypothetical protein